LEDEAFRYRREQVFSAILTQAQMSKPSRFEEAAAAEGKRTGLFQEFWGFLRQNKKWWLLPMLIVFLLLGLLVLLSSTGLAPFIYTLF